VSDDPRHHGHRVGARGEDPGALDHVTAGRVRTRQTPHQFTDRIVVHADHTSPPRFETPDDL
jgi:hypothetical protein